MATKYILETEVKKHYANAKANDYFLNGKHTKQSKLEETVKNGTKVIKKTQVKTLLSYLSNFPLEEAYQKIAKKLKIDVAESTEVIRALDRNGYVKYRKGQNKCTLTKKGNEIKPCTCKKKTAKKTKKTTRRNKK